jgi:dual specificity protein kinase YAK1
MGRQKIIPSELTQQPTSPTLDTDLIFSAGSEITNAGITYRVESLLGVGHFGQVYRVVQTNLHEGTSVTYAMKISQADPKYKDQFIQEANLLEFIRENCPSLSFYQFSFVYDSRYCLVCDLFGETLGQRLKNSGWQGFSLVQVRSILQQLLKELASLHSLGFVHLDVKPQNIVFENMESVRLIDFGCCRTPNGTETPYCQTRYYRAPEVVLRLPFSTATDIWSVGCIGAELLLGRPLFIASSERHLLVLMEERLGMFPREMQDENFDGQGRVVFAPAFTNVKRHFRQKKLKDIVKKYVPTKSPELTDCLDYVYNKDVFSDLLSRMLSLDPRQRITADAALNHEFFALEL